MKPNQGELNVFVLPAGLSQSKLQRLHLAAVPYLMGFCVICPPKHLKANKANLGR